MTQASLEGKPTALAVRSQARRKDLLIYLALLWRNERDSTHPMSGAAVYTIIGVVHALNMVKEQM